MSGMNVTLTFEHGWFFASVLALVLQQSLLFVIPVVMQRKKTGIEPPTMYPTDTQIKELKLTPTEVDRYMCCQRMHLNNVEFLVVLWPVYFICGMMDPMYTAYAGAVIFAGRLATAIGYWHGADKRAVGAWFHVPEFYLYFTLGKLSYDLITSAAAQQ